MRSKKTFIVANIILPLILGAVIYYIISPNVYFVKQLDSAMGNLLPGRMLIDFMRVNSAFVRALRNYLPDIAWGYSLMFGLYLALRNEISDMYVMIMIAFAFSTFIEILQITPSVSGTFDIIDIAYEFLAEIVAILIIKIYTFRRKAYEKDR